MQRPLYLDRRRPKLAQLSLLSGVAGLFRDDSLDIEITTLPGGAATIVTPAMTRVFAMAAGEAHMTAKLRVEPSGYLEYLPEPALLCADSALVQRNEMDIAAGGCIVAADLLSFGRVAAGERHAYRHYEQRTDLRVAGKLVMTERIALGRTDQAVEGRSDPLHRFACYGVLHVVCGCEPAAGLLVRLRSALSALPLYSGASLTAGEEAIGVRLLGSTASQVRDAAACLARTVRARHAIDQV